MKKAQQHLSATGSKPTSRTVAVMVDRPLYVLSTSSFRYTTPAVASIFCCCCCCCGPFRCCRFSLFFLGQYSILGGRSFHRSTVPRLASDGYEGKKDQDSPHVGPATYDRASRLGLFFAEREAVMFLPGTRRGFHSFLSSGRSKVRHNNLKILCIRPVSHNDAEILHPCSHSCKPRSVEYYPSYCSEGVMFLPPTRRGLDPFISSSRSKELTTCSCCVSSASTTKTNNCFTKKCMAIKFGHPALVYTCKMFTMNPKGLLTFPSRGMEHQVLHLLHYLVLVYT